MNDRAEDFARRHPRSVRLLTGALVVWSAYELFEAVRLHVRVAALVGQLQREASESLGG